MNSINLLPKKSQDSQKLLLVRKWVTLVTTISLVVYVVIAAGTIGWWLFAATLDAVTARNLAELEAQIKQNSTTEALVLEADSRQKLIESFLQSRVSTASLASQLVPKEESLILDEWKYGSTGHTLGGSFQALSGMEKYTERIKAQFPNINITLLATEGNGVWKGDFKL